MNKNLKIILIEIIIIIVYFISFELYYNDLLLYCFISIFILLIFSFHLLDLLFSTKNKEMKTILKKYNNILVQIDDKNFFDSYNIIKVKKFKNLVVAHKRLGEPILYFYKNNFINFIVNDDNNVLFFKLFIYNLE